MVAFHDTIRFGTQTSGVFDLTVEILREKHLAVRGPTGQRKTLFILSLFLQYLALPTDGVVFIDLGGDQAAYWLLATAAEALGKPVYLFSLDDSHDSCSWDPVRSTRAYATDTTLAASGVAQGLSLLHGGGYGRSFWGRLNQSMINEAFDRLRAKGNRIPAFRDLVSMLKRMGSEQRSSQHTSEAFLAAEQLLRYGSLTEEREQQLCLGKAIDEGALVYYYLPAALRGEAARAVASLAVWSVMVECATRSALGLPARYVHLGVDEYPQIAAARSAVDSTLTLARKWNVQAYLVYQDDSQLITPDGDLRPVIRSQCQRVLFSCESEDEIRELRHRSLDVLRPDTTQSLRGLSSSTSLRQVLEPGLTRNEIMELSGVAMDAYAVLKLGDRHRDPMPFTIIPPTTTPAAHALLKHKPLPSRSSWKEPVLSEPETPAPTGLTKCAVTREGKPTPVAGALGKLLKQLKAEEAWRLSA